MSVDTQNMEHERMRGFSLTFSHMQDMQFIEGGELERAWKASRREKVKQQELKIWEDFISEQDVVQSIYKTDPYQFVDELPVAPATEFLKSKLEIKEEQHKSETPRSEGMGDGDGTDKDKIDPDMVDSDIFHIYADNNSNSDQDNNSVNDVESPCTVRENTEEIDKEKIEKERNAIARKESADKMAILEDSIYCAKVRELRQKIIDELMTLILTIEGLDLSKLEMNDIQVAKRRAVEFSTRFNRVHMYQLQRQMQDIKRNMNVLPFAKHTHFHSQMTRVTSLHSNYYHAIQMLVKAVVGMTGSEEWREAGRGAAAAGGGLTAVSAAVRAPHPPHRDQGLYDDELVSCCDKLNVTIDEYLKKVSSALNPVDKYILKKTQKKKGAVKKQPVKSISETDTRFSMYSSQSTIKSMNISKIISKENQSWGTSKASCTINKDNNVNKEASQTKVNKSPGRSRRPLMRGGPSEEPPRRKHVSREADIQTLVQDVTVNAFTPTQSVTGDADSQLDETKTPRVLFEARSSSTTPRSSRLPPLSRLSSIQSKKKNVLSPQLSLRSPKKRTSFTTPSTITEVKTIERLEEIPIFEIEDPGITPVCKVQLLKNREMNTNAQIIAPPMEPKLESPRKKMPKPPEVYDVTQLLKKLCGGDMTSSRNEKVQGKSKNTMLLNVNGYSPRSQQPSTPELLKILEETIQKKLPKKPTSPDPKKYRLQFNIPDKIGQTLFAYRSKYIQHMLSSSMYANSVVDKPWEVIGRLSEQILHDLIRKVAKEIQIKDALKELYKSETKA